MKTTQQEIDECTEELEHNRKRDAELDEMIGYNGGSMCNVRTETLGRMIDDYYSMCELEAMSSASPETVRSMLDRCAELEAENAQLRKLARMANEHECANWPTLEADALLRALLDGGGE